VESFPDLPPAVALMWRHFLIPLSAICGKFS
jgi:hypothetical protein